MVSFWQRRSGVKQYDRGNDQRFGAGVLHTVRAALAGEYGVSRTDGDTVVVLDEKQ